MRCEKPVNDTIQQESVPQTPRTPGTNFPSALSTLDFNAPADQRFSQQAARRPLAPTQQEMLHRAAPYGVPRTPAPNHPSTLQATLFTNTGNLQREEFDLHWDRQKVAESLRQTQLTILNEGTISEPDGKFRQKFVPMLMVCRISDRAWGRLGAL